jgi:acyl carrier protein
MTVESGEGAGTDPRLLSEFANLLRTVTGDTGEWDAAITPNARLEGDLALESVDLAALGELLRDAYGADLGGYFAELDIDQLIELTVADLVAWLARHRMSGDTG